VLASVHQHVRKRVPYLTGRRKRARVISIGKDRAFSAELPIHRASQPNRKALNPAGKRATPLRLDDQVQVIALHRKVNQPQPKARSTGHESPPNGREAGPPAQGRQPRNDPQGDMDGVVTRKPWAAQMRDA
jgi:hypothetical protein